MSCGASTSLKYVQIANSIPRISDDDAAARLILQEYSMKKPLSNSSYSAKILPPAQEINKVYLTNTIHGIEAHNRREEAADCWRQHDMLERSHSRAYKRRASPSPSDSDTAASRQYWAEKKMLAMRSQNQKEMGAHALIEVGLENGAQKMLENKSKKEEKKKKIESKRKKEKKSKKDKKSKKSKEEKKSDNKKRKEETKNDETLNEGTDLDEGNEVS